MQKKKLYSLHQINTTNNRGHYWLKFHLDIAKKNMLLHINLNLDNYHYTLKYFSLEHLWNLIIINYFK